MSEDEWRAQIEVRLGAIDARLDALEAHAAAAAEVLAHAEQMLVEWQELAPVLREIGSGSGAAGDDRTVEFQAAMDVRELPRSATG